MVLAYVEYPKRPPTLEELAKEMEATEKGTKGIEFSIAMWRRRIETEYETDFRPQHMRSNSAEGYAIMAAIKAPIWPFTIIIGPFVPYDLHAILIIGYETNTFIVHDPAKPETPALYLSEDELKLKWYYCFVVKAKPKEMPSYIMTIEVDRTPFPTTVTVDGETTVFRQFKFKIGTTHTIRISPNYFMQENATTRISYSCFSDSVLTTDGQWRLGEYSKRFIFSIRVEFVVRVNYPLRPYVSWFGEGSSFQSEPAERTLPAEGILGQLGFKKVFRGWYEDGQLVTGDLQFVTVVSKPMNLTPRWELDIWEGPAIWYCIGGVVIGLAIAVLTATVVAKRKAHATCCSHKGQPRSGSANSASH